MCVHVHVCKCSQKLMFLCDFVGDTDGGQWLRCICVLPCLYAYRSQILKPRVFFNYSYSYLLIKSLSLNVELEDWARLAGDLSSGPRVSRKHCAKGG